MKLVKIFISTFGFLWILIASAHQFGIITEGTLKGPKYFGMLCLLACSISILIYWYHRPPRTKKLKVCLFDNYLSYLPIYVAQEQGFFKKNEIDVEIISGEGNKKSYQNVIKGDADIGVGDPGVVLRSEKQTILFCSIMDKAGLWGLSTKKELPVWDKEDANGKIFAAYFDPSTTKSIANYLADGDESKIKEIHPRTELIALKNKDTDIVLAMEPMASIAESSDKNIHKCFSGPKFFDEFLFSACYTTPKMVSEKSDELLRFTKAIAEALNFIKNHHLKSIKIAKKVFNHYPAHDIEFATATMIRESVFAESPCISKNSWATFLKVYYTNESMPKNLQEHINNKFSEEAFRNLKKDKLFWLKS